jgi:hypothetical protein
MTREVITEVKQTDISERKGRGKKRRQSHCKKMHLLRPLVLMIAVHV